ncbi:MAG: response regulator transcription factor [Bacteriovoracaceae bacterium]|nr:response regulator transcription factor [Bacteriovoracaceae bacterium]
MSKSRIKILVLDDDVEVKELFKAKLNSQVYQLCFVTKVKDLLLRFFNEQWDICLIDLNLNEAPDAGFHVVKMLRQKEEGYTPILMISRDSQKEKIAHAIECGADDYISKPIDFDVLDSKVDFLVESEGFQLNKLKTLPVPLPQRGAIIDIDYEIDSISEDEIVLVSSSYISKGSLVRLKGDFIVDVFMEENLSLEVTRTETEQGLYKIALALDNTSDYIVSVRTFIREKMIKS